MNFYTAAVKLNKAIDRTTKMIEMTGLSTEEARDHAKRMELNNFRSHVELGIDMMLIYKQIAVEKGLIKPEGEQLKRTYFITIRPSMQDIDFEDFYTIVQKFVSRTCFINFRLTFEQKGTTHDTLGSGFHAHIIAEMRQRSKSEVLRDTVSTFKCCTSANCIQVDILKTQKDLDNTIKYITEYTSDDDHKECTKEHDAQWRQLIGLRDMYTENDLDSYKCLPSIKSDVGQAVTIQNSPTIVELK